MRYRNEAELSRARDTADRANRAKSRFLAAASHDLRQPLQTLALLNGMLRRRPLDPVAAEAIAEQEQAVEAMSRLLGAKLDVRSEVGKGSAFAVTLPASRSYVEPHNASAGRVGTCPRLRIGFF